MDIEKKIGELVVPKHSTIIRARKYSASTGSVNTLEVDRAVPDVIKNVLRAYEEGGSIRLVYTPVGIDRGVSTRKIHEFNQNSGWLDEDKESGREESIRTSLSRTRRMVREYAACNNWLYFCTITLNPAIWNRKSPEGLQKSLSEEAKRWKRKSVKGVRPYSSYAYLYVPEPHMDGAFHLHGLVSLIPDEYMKRYTEEDIKAARPIPHYIVDKIRSGVELWHCTEWDEKYGFNVIERIQDVDRMASYISKYITKEVGYLPVKTRVWHSRGLTKARLLREYAIHKIKDAVSSDVLDFMKTVATISLDGKLLYNEHMGMTSSTDGTRACETLRAATAVINQSDIPKDVLLKQLDSMYEQRGR